MPTVKRSLLWMALASALVGGAGCSDAQLARFAPPGIIKYEEIASGKPPNPEITARIQERRDNGEIDYPVIARTPGPKDRPKPESKDQRETMANDLIKQRDALDVEVAKERADAEADSGGLDEIAEKSQALSEQAKRDIEAARKYQEDLKTPPQEKKE